MKGKRKTVVAVSGGFDPLHVGHLRLFKEAKKLGTHLVVILNNDNWLKRKKGFALMPEEERAELIRALEVVDEVVLTKHAVDDADTSICTALGELRPDVFANAGDRKKPADIPEGAVCEAHGIRMVFFAFEKGKKKHSSSEIVARAASALEGVRKALRPKTRAGKR